MDPQQQALIERINNDPRVDQFALARGSGFLNAAALRELGYDVPDDWTYKSSLGRGEQGVHTSDGFWGFMGKYGIPIGAGITLGYGAGAALTGPSSSGAIPSTAVQPGGVTGGILPGTEAGLGAAVGGGGGGLGGFLGSLGGLKGILGLAGTALGANAQASAQNRGGQFAAQMDLERLLMDRDEDAFSQNIRRQQEGRASGSDAWRKLVSSNYAQNRPQMPNVTPYAAPQRDLSGLQGGAAAMQAEAMARLQGGNPIPPIQQRPLSVDPSLMKPGAWESLSGYTSPWLTLIGRR